MSIKSTGYFPKGLLGRAAGPVLAIILSLAWPTATALAESELDPVAQPPAQPTAAETAPAEAPAELNKKPDTKPQSRVLLPADPFITVSHKWDKAVRGFRKGHNFGLLGSYRRTAFQLSGGGPKKEVSRRLFAGQLRYAYHIQSDRSVGYFLGSTLGYIEPQSSGPEGLEYQRYMEFPSLMIGGVFNGSSYFRLHTYFEGFLTRLEGFRREPLINAIATTGETIRAGMGFDLFYLLEWGVTFNASYYWSKLRVPKPESDASHGVDSVIILGNSFSIGLVLHLI